MYTNTHCHYFKPKCSKPSEYEQRELKILPKSQIKYILFEKFVKECENECHQRQPPPPLSSMIIRIISTTTTTTLPSSSNNSIQLF
eukprot:m.270314 g.270314  ORF g.270314 m.270314 type:complete len:86 (-) comp89096_c0_seq1:63-320(-)